MIFEWFTFGKGIDWIGKLWGKLWKGRERYGEELERINNEILTDPLDIARYYIEPECQNINPADTRKESPFVVKQPMMKMIDEFFRRHDDEPGEKQLFVLSDAGMGKTALLTMLRLAHLTSFWPKKTRCVLKKLGKKTIDDLKQITDRTKTILLLDSLDEDAEAYGRVRVRVLEILNETQNFEKVVITCRTQFFPKVEGDAFGRENMINIGGFVCPVIYLSYFTDARVRLYLEKRFKKKWIFFTDETKLAAATDMVFRMGSLKFRPMLLSFIDDLMESPIVKDFPFVYTMHSKSLGKIRIHGKESIDKPGEYAVYDSLVKSWLIREQRKTGVEPDHLLTACVILATVLHMRGLREISETDLDNLIKKIADVSPIKAIDIKGRSLVNKNSEGDFRFSHYSIQEFCVTKLLLEKKVFTPKNRIPVTNLMMKWLMEIGRSPNFIELLEFKNERMRFTNSLGMEFVLLAPGEFVMGSPEDEPERDDDERPHRVTLTKLVYLQTTPVTQAQWQAVMGSNPAHFKGDDRPVEFVSWDDAVEFAKKLGKTEGREYRLPTEAEWEYACRAGSDNPYCFDDDAGKLGDYAWYDENSDGETHSVGQKKPNAWGFYDMHGNVWEWCLDWYGEYQRGLVTDPTGPKDGAYRVKRGGSWGDDARDCRAAYGQWGGPGIRDFTMGFRLACLPGH